MQFLGTLIAGKLSDVKTGTSANGKSWCMGSVVLSKKTDNGFDNTYYTCFFNEKQKEDALSRKGQNVVIAGTMKQNTYNEKVRHEITTWYIGDSIEKACNTLLDSYNYYSKKKEEKK